jgi:hypothetical protein
MVMRLLLSGLCAGDKLGGLVPDPIESCEFLFCILHGVKIGGLSNRGLVGSSKVETVQ